ncbi:MAG: Gfo/Idh/MocA family protein [Vicinamibacterales bacterium]
MAPPAALILGWSSLARRRIAPALASLGATSIDVASFTREPERPPGIGGRTFRDYRTALDESESPIVYVSTRNHEHVAWAAAALESGRHVIVDKPAALGEADTGALVDLAARRGRFVAEATTYPWHPQFAELARLAREAAPVTRLVATFSFPPLAATDVRHVAAWGGGALWDLGPYAVTPGRLLFGAPPATVHVEAVTRPGDEVETSFSIVMRYPGDRLLVGHFGSTTAYVNRLEAIGPRLAVRVERAFTTAPNQPCRLTGEHLGQPLALEVPAADAFGEFLRDAIAASTDTDRYRAFAEWMLADAAALARLRRAAGG